MTNNQIIVRAANFDEYRIIPFGDGTDNFTSGGIYFQGLGNKFPTHIRCLISSNFGVPMDNPRLFAVSYQNATSCQSPGAVSYKNCCSSFT